MSPMLMLSDVTVRFGGVTAVNGVTLSIPGGIVFGIIGPNGAGKTTLFNAISGFIRPAEASRISFEGQEIAGWAVEKVAKLGIARTFQNIALLRERTVRDNLLIGLHLSFGYRSIATLFPSRRIAREEAIAETEIDDVADMLLIPRSILNTSVDVLSIGQQKKVEVARAVLRKPKLLLLDEPAGGLNDKETADLKTSLDTLRRWSTFSIIVVDHDMNLIMNFCERIAVLDSGALVAEGSPSEMQAHPDVVEAYLGHG